MSIFVPTCNVDVADSTHYVIFRVAAENKSALHVSVNVSSVLSSKLWIVFYYPLFYCIPSMYNLSNFRYVEIIRIRLLFDGPVTPLWLLLTNYISLELKTLILEYISWTKENNCNRIFTKAILFLYEVL